MNLTVAYVTSRRDPLFSRFLASLAREVASHSGLSAELVVVDRLDGARPLLPERSPLEMPVRFVRPKPTVWQGPHRLTSKNYFAASNARNTALAHARGRHVAFVDDLSVLLPGWLRAHLWAAEGGFVLCGSTCKNKHIAVDAGGSVTSFTRFDPGQDSRLKVYPQGGPTRCPGSSLFGGTFSVPLELALEVNGMDEVCDSIGGEDYDFGTRLERAGAAVFFDSGCATMEDEDAHHSKDEEVMLRVDKPWPGSDGPYSSNYLLNRLLREPTRKWTLGNPFELRAVRDWVSKGGGFPEVARYPARHWVDGQPLSEM